MRVEVKNFKHFQVMPVVVSKWWESMPERWFALLSPSVGLLLSPSALHYY
jgi:hypothetical protein